MNLERSERYPWLAIAVVVIFVLGASAGAIAWTRKNVERTRADASVRLNREAERAAASFDELIDDNRDLGTLTAYVVGPVRSTPQVAATLVRRLLRAQQDKDAYRVGVFYEPGAFSGASQFGLYVNAQGASAPATPAYSATQWYRRARAARGQTVYTLVDGDLPYISAAKAFLDGHRPAGVVTVDTLVSSLHDELLELTSSNAHLWITAESGQTLIDVQRGTASRAGAAEVTLANAPWTLHASVSPKSLEASIRQTVGTGSAAIALVWLLGAAFVAALHMLYATRRDTNQLKHQRAQLQSEIATHLDTEARLREAAYHDTLTGLPNRAFFLRQLQDVLEQRRRSSGTEYAVLFIDLDRFYVVNDSMGHNVGDELLRAIACRLEETVPPHALVARLGGDEFVLLLPAEGPAVREAIAIAEDVLEALRNPFIAGDREVFSGASIGIVKIDDTYEDAATVLRDADISMYQAKNGGRARYAVFDHAMRRRVSQQIELEGALRGAVERDEIFPYYQPIVDVRDEHIVGFEALARWQRDGERVVAGDFVPVAEQAGMMRAIDAELFAQVCRDVTELTAIAPGVRISVNVSAMDLTRASLLPDIDSTLERFSVPPESLRLEITETAVMEDAERALAMLAELRARRFEIVVDDFGAGYSSLSYLRRLPLAGVKIDRSFIATLTSDAPSLEIVRAIVALAKTLGLHTTAEGVERPEQLELLRKLGVDFAQGFWFSPPVDFEQAKSFFAVRS